jgi:hypothetical protein
VSSIARGWVLGWGDLPRATRIAGLRKIAKRQRVVADALAAALRGEPPPLVLEVKRRISPKRLAELTPLQKRQFRSTIGDGDWGDGVKRRTPEDFFLSIAEIVDQDGKHAFDLFSVMVDSGAVYRAGTTELATPIAQLGFDTKDRRLADALHQAVHEERRRKA